MRDIFIILYSLIHCTKYPFFYRMKKVDKNAWNVHCTMSDDYICNFALDIFASLVRHPFSLFINYTCFYSHFLSLYMRTHIHVWWWEYEAVQETHKIHEQNAMKYTCMTSCKCETIVRMNSTAIAAVSVVNHFCVITSSILRNFETSYSIWHLLNVNGMSF